jgi:hypothetical protein
MHTYIFSGTDRRRVSWDHHIEAINLKEAIKSARSLCRRTDLKYGNDCRRLFKQKNNANI